MKRKIIFMIENLEGGGAERVTSVLANHLSNNGFEVHIIIFNKKDNEYFVNNIVNKHYVNFSNIRNKVIKIVSKICKLHSIINEIQADVVISLSMTESNMFLISQLLFGNTNIILSERNDPTNHPKSKILRIMRNLLYSLSDRVVFQTQGAKEYFPNKIQKKSFVIANPIKEGLPMMESGERTKKIVNFCRLDSQKNLYLLIDAFLLLNVEYPDYELLIYGKGDLEDELKQYVKDKGGERNIIFKGYESDIHNKIINSKMYVSSSNYEGISNSMLESLAIGLPTICTDCPPGGARMFIKSYENGILVPVGDTVQLYNAMKILIEDNELCDKLSRNATKIRQELSSDKIILRWLDCIESLFK